MCRRPATRGGFDAMLLGRWPTEERPAVPICPARPRRRDALGVDGPATATCRCRPTSNASKTPTTTPTRPRTASATKPCLPATPAPWPRPPPRCTLMTGVLAALQARGVETRQRHPARGRRHLPAGQDGEPGRAPDAQRVVRSPAGHPGRPGALPPARRPRGSRGHHHRAHAGIVGPTAASTTGDTNIFITPGFSFKVVDVLITNFHLPKSTLMMLVSAFAGLRPHHGPVPPRHCPALPLFQLWGCDAAGTRQGRELIQRPGTATPSKSSHVFTIGCHQRGARHNTPGLRSAATDQHTLELAHVARPPFMRKTLSLHPWRFPVFCCSGAAPPTRLTRTPRRPQAQRMRRHSLPIQHRRWAVPSRLRCQT